MVFSSSIFMCNNSCLLVPMRLRALERIESDNKRGDFLFCLNLCVRMIADRAQAIESKNTVRIALQCRRFARFLFDGLWIRLKWWITRASNVPHVGMQCAVLYLIVIAVWALNRRYALDQAPLNQADTRQESKPAKSPWWTHIAAVELCAIQCGIRNAKIYGTKTKRLNCAVAHKPLCAITWTIFRRVSWRTKDWAIICAAAVCIRESFFKCAVCTHTLLH